MRRLGVALAAVLVAGVGVVALVAFLADRDEARLGDGSPGRPAAVEVPGGGVEIVAPRPADRRALRPLAEEFAAPAGVGPGVRIRASPRLGPGIHALADGSRLDVTSPTDPRLRAFIEFHLGRAG